MAIEVSDSVVTSIARLITTFKTKLHHIARGTFKDAFSTSSVDQASAGYSVDGFKVAYRRDHAIRACRLISN